MGSSNPALIRTLVFGSWRFSATVGRNIGLRRIAPARGKELVRSRFAAMLAPLL